MGKGTKVCLQEGKLKIDNEHERQSEDNSVVKAWDAEGAGWRTAKKGGNGRHL